MLEFPVLMFKENDSNLYAISSNRKHELFLSSNIKSPEKFYNGLTIVTAVGEVYKVKNAKVAGTASLKYCIRYFQKMIKIDIVFEEKSEYISLKDLKIWVMDHIKKHPKKWLVLDTIDGIQEMVDNSKSYHDLFMIFR